MVIIINSVVFIFGASIGSFLNVLIDRLPKEESINGRSHCDFCGKKIAWYHLIPVLSFFILKSKTKCCGKKLSWQYPLVETVTGLSFLLIFNFQFSVFNEFSIFNFQTLLLFGIFSCLIVIFVSDLKYHLISDYLLLVLFTFSLLSKIVIPAKAGIQSINFSLDPLLRGGDILSGFIVGLPIFLIFFISKERAMGLGDVYLTAIMGFLLGWQKGFLALYIAFVTGAIFGLIIILLKHKKLKSKIAFGPFLVIGTATMLFWGEKILEVIKRMYGF